MSLRKNFDSFTSQHKLRDAQEEFTEAVYRFRAAEEANTPNLVALKREMEFVGRKVEYCRAVSIRDNRLRNTPNGLCFQRVSRACVGLK